MKAAYWKIKGQPDDHPDEFVAQAVEKVLAQCSERRFDVDFREQT